MIYFKFSNILINFCNQEIWLYDQIVGLRICFIIPMKLKWGYTGFILSIFPVHLSVCTSICGHNHVRSLSSNIQDGSILFTHLINKFKRVCHVLSAVQNSKIAILGNFFKFVILTLYCVHVMWKLKLIPDLSYCSHITFSLWYVWWFI